MLAAWLTLEDAEPTRQRPLRPAPWMVAAFSTLGFRYEPQQTEHQATRKTWRTWRVEEHRPGSTDQETASFLNNGFEGKGEHKMHASHPFMACYLGARHHDTLELARQHGIRPSTTADTSGSGLTQLSLKPADGDLAQYIGENSKSMATRSLYLAAALVTAGFPFSHWREDGAAVLLGTSGPTPGSLTMADVTLPAAISAATECATLFQETNPGKVGRVTGAVGGEPATVRLAHDHIFRYVCISILHRLAIRAVEQQMDNARDARRTYFFTSEVNPQHAALVNWDEYHANRERIAQHLTAGAFA